MASGLDPHHMQETSDDEQYMEESSTSQPLTMGTENSQNNILQLSEPQSPDKLRPSQIIPQIHPEMAPFAIFFPAKQKKFFFDRKI